MKKSALFITLMLISSTVFTQTYHSGDISSNETWTSGTHIITGDVTVLDGVTLTIDPDCIVKFDYGTVLCIQGVLIADGSDDHRIYFTSNQSIPAPGDWKYIYLDYADPGTLLDYCEVSYGGSIGCMVYIRGCYDNVHISNSSFSYSNTSGIYIRDYNTPQSHVTIDNCLIEENASYGIYSSVSGQHEIINCLIRNNGHGFYSDHNTHNFGYNNIIINNTAYGIFLNGNTTLTFGTDLKPME